MSSDWIVAPLVFLSLWPDRQDSGLGPHVWVWAELMWESADFLLKLLRVLQSLLPERKWLWCSREHVMDQTRQQPHRLLCHDMKPQGLTKTHQNHREKKEKSVVVKVLFLQTTAAVFSGVIIYHNRSLCFLRQKHAVLKKSQLYDKVNLFFNVVIFVKFMFWDFLTKICFFQQKAVKLWYLQFNNKQL